MNFKADPGVNGDDVEPKYLITSDPNGGRFFIEDMNEHETWELKFLKSNRTA